MRDKRILIFMALLLVISLFLFMRLYSWDVGTESESGYSSVAKPKETCMQCHEQKKGFSKFHDPENIGCAICHLGDPNSADKEESHHGLVRIPGNLSDAAQTCGTCHPNELEKIGKSLMTTNSGLVAVDKYVFGEADNPNGTYDIRNIGHSQADEHLRDLCANCHLGAEKTDYGEISEVSRGGGCNACHLNYSDQASSGLADYLASGQTELPSYHPSTDIFVKDVHCFGCHSRSSRISTNYMGWQETLKSEHEVEGDTMHRTFQDKRVYKRQSEDVHHTGGMLCIDCHSSHEVMGDGKSYIHEEDAVHLACDDCHYRDTPNTVSFDSLDLESMLVFSHRDYTHDDKEILIAKGDGHPLVNTFIDSGRAYLIGKGDGQTREIVKQGEQCARDQAHAELSCSSCHSQWAPRCIGCHNSYDKNEAMGYDLLEKKMKEGSWIEHVFEFSAGLPTLGVREDGGKKHIEPAIPGMIMTIDHDSFEGDSTAGNTFHRLYAPNAPHTIGKQSRNCASCHVDPSAIGFGQGSIDFGEEGVHDRLIFNPAYAINENDGLPEDAWIPFFKQSVHSKFSTRSNFRPFNLEEQKAILTVGACLQCHDAESKLMKSSLQSGIKPLLLRMSDQCKLPDFESNEK